MNKIELKIIFSINIMRNEIVAIVNRKLIGKEFINVNTNVYLCNFLRI